MFVQSLLLSSLSVPDPNCYFVQDEGKVATIVVTLPVRFSGGALIVRDCDDTNKTPDTYCHQNEKSSKLEWTAFLDQCTHEVDTVTQGARLTISYNVFLYTDGVSHSPSLHYIRPSQKFLEQTSCTLNASRGQKIAYLLQEEYDLTHEDHQDSIAESLVCYVRAPSRPIQASQRLMLLDDYHT